MNLKSFFLIKLSLHACCISKKMDMCQLEHWIKIDGQNLDSVVFIMNCSVTDFATEYYHVHVRMLVNIMFLKVLLYLY